MINSGDYQQKKFSCWDQYLAMAFAQLTCRDSLRDIEAYLRSMQGKLYHILQRRSSHAVDKSTVYVPITLSS